MESKKIFEELQKVQSRGNEQAKKILEAGFRIDVPPENVLKRSNSCYPHGFFWVTRNYDGKLIGRLEPINTARDKWQGRYWFFGGGTTYGYFSTRWMAAQWLLIKNSELDEGWDSV